ncbi:unnamed protein product [Schistosoma rodhaini]|uniref:MSP domain-containing protein n=1 Tax=Schistosoma rodhaini TaxID=6188 RepID=A0AA85ET15_9TREM|nr:unnamed protein product [Schistosoma rodhaini]
MLDDKSIHRINGIELTNEIVWEEWVPGEKYTKILRLHNVDRISHNFTFLMPRSGVFSSVHKNKFRISPGTTIELPITFRPTKLMELCEEMTFDLSGKTTNVTLKAILPTYLLKLPENINFGPVAVNTIKTHIFTLKNMTKLKTDFKLKVTSPLQISLDEGTLNSFEKKAIEIIFAPITPGYIKTNVICIFGDKRTWKMKRMDVTGTAENDRLHIFPVNVKTSESENSGSVVFLSFDNVSTGRSSQETIVVENYSNVDSSIKIKPVSRNAGFDGSTVFRSLVSVATIPGQSRSQISFTYTPRMPKSYDIGYYKICSLNSYGETMIKCMGKSKDVNIQLSTNYCTFPITHIGEFHHQVVNIINHSDYSTVYELVAGQSQMYIDENNQSFTIVSTVFPIIKGISNGIIKSKETLQLIIGFYPQVPGHFYRRFTLLVCNQEPQFLHLFGTGHNLIERPHHLKPKHLMNIELYNQKLGNEINTFQQYVYDNHQNGYEIYSEMMQSSEIMMNPPLLSLNHTIWDFTSNSDLLSKALLCVEQFNKTINQGLPLNLDDLAICNTLIIQNCTNHVLIIHWTSNKQLDVNHQSINNDNQYEVKINSFRIEPQTKELAPNSSTEFTILFTPANMCQYYHQEFEGFAMYKNQRDDSLISSEKIKPPYCLLVNCYGHTFPSNKQPFTPCYEMNKSKIIFDPIEYCENKYDSISLYNKSEYPLLIQHKNLMKCLNYEKFDENSFNIQLIPSITLIPANSYKVIVFRCETNQSYADIKKKMAIKEDEIILKGLEIVSMNKQPEYEWRIPIEIDFTIANITLENNGELYFIPTHIGSYTQKEFNITNISPYKTEFCWEIISDDKTELEVYPTKGVLLPNEIQSQLWTFHPTQITNCIYKPRLIYWRLNQSNQMISHEIKQKELRIITMSGNVQLSIEPETIHCHPLLVNTSAKYKINFHNPSIISTHFCTIIKPIYNESNQDLKLNEFIIINPNENLISGHSTKSITIDICPKSKGSFCFHLFYRLYTTNEFISNQKNNNKMIDGKNSKSDGTRKYLTEEILAATIFVEAVYPTLRITDIHGSGSLNNTSPVELWRSLDIDSLNISLEADPTDYELKDTINSRPLYRDHPKSLDCRGPEFDLFIGTSVIAKNDEINNSKALLCFLVENSSLIEVDFAFMFPEDLRLELPNWAESGHYEEAELQQLHIENHSLIDIQPRRRLLKPGEYSEIMITYNHNLSGCHQLPVIWKINGGREIKLNMIGITLPLNQPYLQLPYRKYILNPTPIGLGDYRLGYLFQMKLKNPSLKTIHFHISPLLKWLPREQKDKESKKSELNEKFLEYNLSILYCVQNQGLIKPNEVYALEWRFRPIEAKTYTAYCYIHIIDAEVSPVTGQSIYSDTILLELIAIGYDPKQLGPKEIIANPQRVRIPTAIENHIISLDRNPQSIIRHNDDDIDEGELTFRNFPPLARRIKIPIDSWISLSHHLIELNRIIIGTCCRRIIHMTNRFSSDINRLPVNNRSIYRFRWFTEFPNDTENVTISPRIGRIKPGQTIQELVTFTANGLPRFTEIKLICELIDEHEENKYYEELKAWQSEIDRLKVEFTITDNDLTKKKTKSEAISSQSDEIDMDEFCQKWPKPIHTKPVYVYLTINAEIINDEAAKIYGVNNEGKTSFIDYAQFFNSNHSAAKALSSKKVQDSIWSLHQHLFTDLLTSLIDSLIFNNEFVQMIQKIVIPPENRSDASPLLVTPLNNNEIMMDDNDDDDPVPLWIQIKSDHCYKSNELSTNYNINDINKTTDQLNHWIPEIVKEKLNKQDMKSIHEETVDTMCIQNPAIQWLIEDALAGILSNILDEVNEKEFEITTRPRIIALPPTTLQNKLEDK